LILRNDEHSEESVESKVVLADLNQGVKRTA